MFPWDHLAIGYIATSLLFRARGRLLDDESAVVAALGTQFPDLVDKPLAWTFEVLPSGTTLAHSVFVAVPLSMLIYALARLTGLRRLGVAFSVGYLLHLPADVLYGPLTTGGPVPYGAVLWPLIPTTGEPASGTLLRNTVHYIVQYYGYLGSTRALGFLFLEVGLLSGALALWVADGKPGYRPLLTAVRRVRA